MKDNVSDREMNKFVEIAGKHVVRVTNLGNFTIPENADAFDATYPDAVTEVYRYFSGGLAGTLLKTVTITYSNAAHDQLVSMVLS